MGQFNFASVAHSWNFAASIPGTLALRSSTEDVIAPLSSVMVQVVSIDSGVNPAAPRTNASFMLKQPECAAATSSSGFVPIPCSNLDKYEY